MKKPRICVSIVDADIEAIKEIEHEVDLFEVRIDRVGENWPDLVKYLRKPWIACNRRAEEGGKNKTSETKRIEELTWAAEAGACFVDLELETQNLTEIVPLIKARAKCILSFHDIAGTPAYKTLAGIVESQIKAGADICKVVTLAHNFEDNLSLLKLIRQFPETKLVAFAMGEPGRISRILCPLAGGYFTYACLAGGKEAADGQMTVRQMNEIYQQLRK
jgi:3-dehydroquinate dehydratase type I